MHIEQEIKDEIFLVDLTLSHVCVCTKSGPRFPLTYAIGFVCVQWFEVIGFCSICCIVWIVDQHTLNFE